MKKLTILITAALFLMISIPSFAEERSLDTKIEIVRLQLNNVKLRGALIAKQFAELKAQEAQLIAQLKDLQAQKEKEKKIEKEDTEKE